MKPNKRNVWKIVIIIIASMGLCQVLFDPLSGLIALSEKIQAQVGLPQARAKWEAQKIDHYSFDIRGYFPLTCLFGGNIEVDNGAVIRTGRSSDTDPSIGDHDIREPGFGTSSFNPLCDYRNYTIPKLFDEVEHWQYYPSITSISFDPQYGFISAVGFGSSGGYGLFSPIISDCCGGFSISNFQVLDE